MTFLALAAIGSIPVMAQQELNQDKVEVVSFCVVMPVGRILLIGKNDFLGAVKFLHNEERKDGNTYSKYESFELQRGRAKKVGEGEIFLRNPSSGGKGWFFHEGPSSLLGPPIKIGDFTLCAAAAGLEHSTVYFWNKPHKVDRKVRMAPTPWKEISEMNLSDSRIKWFSYDEKRARKVMPIDKIWE